jgi:hypothetical protein
MSQLPVAVELCDTHSFARFTSLIAQEACRLKEAPPPAGHMCNPRGDCGAAFPCAATCTAAIVTLVPCLALRLAGVYYVGIKRVCV